MPKEWLSGSLDEQCEFLYRTATDKMAEGNYTGAVYALREVVRHRPDYKDAARLLALARSRKRQQRNTLIFSLLGAILFVGIGTSAGLSNDFALLALALVGLLVGYAGVNLVSSLRRSKAADQ